MPQRKTRRRYSLQNCSTKMDFLLMRKLEKDPAGLLAMLGAPVKRQQRRRRRE